MSTHHSNKTPLTWHPYAETFPLLEGAEREALKQSLQATKGNKDQPIHYRMVSGKRQGLDGRNRESVCLELGIEPTYKLVNVSDEDVREYIIRRNVTRRHLTPEMRNKLIADLRSEGKSTREIADTIGTSQSTVQKNLPGSGESKNSPDEPKPQQNATLPDKASGNTGSTQTSLPDKVTGKDGKTYAAEKPPVLCSQCTRGVRVGTGAVPGCNECKKARKEAEAAAAKARGEKKDEAKAAAQGTVLDNHGTEIPAKLRDRWADPWLREEVEFLEVILDQFLRRRMADGIKRHEKHLPFLNHKDFIDGIGMVQNTLEQLIDHARGCGLWDAVCPSCSGKGCDRCGSKGLVPESEYDRLTAKK